MVDGAGCLPELSDGVLCLVLAWALMIQLEEEPNGDFEPDPVPNDDFEPPAGSNGQDLNWWLAPTQAEVQSAELHALNCMCWLDEFETQRMTREENWLEYIRRGEREYQEALAMLE